MQNSAPSTPPDRIERRDAAPDELAGCLRAMLGLDPEEPTPGERAASLGEPLPLIVAGLDVGAWLAWCLAGLPLFEGELPTLRRTKLIAARILTALAMLRTKGCISEASTLTRTTRKVFRDNLRSAGLYPWRGGKRREEGQTHGA